MRLLSTQLIYSPSDLIQFVESPFASWMQRQHLADPGSVTPDADDPMQQVLARRGGEHETSYLDQLRGAGGKVVEVARYADPAETLAAIAAKVDVIYQAPLAADGFRGTADFLRLVDPAAPDPEYAVWDTKLARQPRPYFVIQLCCYADMLGRMTGRLPTWIGLILGDGTEHRYRTTEFFASYQRIRAAFLALMARFPAGGPPVPDASANHGVWAGEASRWLLARDHLSQVAGISRGQVARLNACGVQTMQQLAAAQPARVPGISAPVLQRLHQQARLQRASAGQARPSFELLDPPPDNPRAGLAGLPPASPGDVYFDMEGYPAAGDWLEYLFGAVTVADGQPRFEDWWAHDASGERTAFEAVVDWLHARWQADPAMHIYHYASYEPAALKRLMCRFGTREDQVDALLRGQVFIDLYTVVRRSVRVGEPAYSLKNVEHLYREARAGAVTDAAASVVMYDQWCESGEPGDWQASLLLKAIRDYNEDDCVSTWQLAEWLRAQQRERGIEYQPPGTPGGEKAAERPLSEPAAARRALAQQLLATLPPDDDADAGQRERRRVWELLAWLLEFHRRADKPMWWQYFERQAATVEDLWDDPDCLADVHRTGQPEGVKQSWRYTYRFDPAQETKLHAGSKVAFVPDIGLSAEIETFQPDGTLTIKVGSKTLRGSGISALPERASLIPKDHVKADPIPGAITAVAQDLLATGDVAGAIGDFLYRRPPRCGVPGGQPLQRHSEAVLEAAIRVVSNLDASCLCLQGPPGTGKTYTAAKVIVALLADGRSVGVLSNSHKAVLNLMAEVCKVGGDAVRGTKVGGDADDAVLQAWPQLAYAPSSEAGEGGYPGEMVGGTAWFFARPGMAGALDYLFVDEAGQVSVANLVGAGRSARNLVLLGDQMQLRQPVQGVHPGESGLSVLEYYLAGQATIPPELGLFLGTSRRMHPAVCRFISDAVYEGRLEAAPGNERRVIQRPPRSTGLVRRDAGLQFIPVEHAGNTQASDEEIAIIVQLVQDLAGCEHTGRAGESLGRLDPSRDILIVAPYNLQVRKLIDALPTGTRVGTVDKFQGQEAPVVIVSMCTSAGEEGGRGLKFVLDQNRLNVAISRAQSLALIVGDPRLVEAGANSVDDMRRLNLYCWIQDVGQAD